MRERVWWERERRRWRGCIEPDSTTSLPATLYFPSSIKMDETVAPPLWLMAAAAVLLHCFCLFLPPHLFFYSWICFCVCQIFILHTVSRDEVVIQLFSCQHIIHMANCLDLVNHYLFVHEWNQLVEWEKDRGAQGPFTFLSLKSPSLHIHAVYVCIYSEFICICNTVCLQCSWTGACVSTQWLCVWWTIER